MLVSDSDTFQYTLANIDNNIVLSVVYIRSHKAHSSHLFGGICIFFHYTQEI